MIPNRNQFYVNEAIKDLFIRDGYKCQVCGKLGRQCCHRIPRTKEFIKKYGKEIINHIHNLGIGCDLYCNGTMNIQNKPMRIERLIELIKTRGDEKLSFDEITEIINAN